MLLHVVDHGSNRELLTAAEIRRTERVRRSPVRRRGRSEHSISHRSTSDL
jgi:hypothetical protein